MPLSHAERQRLYRDRHESKPEAKERLAVAKKATREENKRTNTAAKNAYECSLQKLRSHRARDKKKLKKVNMLRRKDGLSAITLKQLAGRGGGARAVAAASTPSPPSAPPAIPTQRKRSRRRDTSSDTDTTVELSEGTTPDHRIVDVAFHAKSTRTKEKNCGKRSGSYASCS